MLLLMLLIQLKLGGVGEPAKGHLEPNPDAASRLAAKPISISRADRWPLSGTGYRAAFCFSDALVLSRVVNPAWTVEAPPLSKSPLFSSSPGDTF